MPENLNRASSLLQPQSNTLIDRDSEITELSQLLSSGQRLITLIGPGGIGKTGLSLQLTQLLADAFSDGVYFIDLTPANDSSQLIARVAQEVGETEHEADSLANHLLAWMRGKHALLVLDNVEQIPDAAAMIDSWFQATDQLAFLVTSRIALQLPAERQYPLKPLSLPDPQAELSLEQIASYGAIALFLRSTQEILPHFEFNNSNAAYIIEICSQLDALPLAIKLAAASMRRFTPRQLVSQLHEYGILQVLNNSAPNLPARQQTIQATLLWSYNILSLPEQSLFTRLSIFVSGWNLRSAEAICADASASTSQIQGQDIVTLLQHLIDHTLVQQLLEEGREPRFIFQQSIQEFAKQQLDIRNERELIQQRHANYYIDLVTQACAQYERGQAQAFAPIHADIDNLRSAFDWALKNGMHEATANAIVQLGPFWAGRMPVTLQWLEDVLKHKDQLPPLLYAKILLLTSSLSWEVFRNPSHARELCEESVSIYRSMHDLEGLAMALNQLAHIAISMGDPNLLQIDAYLATSLGIQNTLGNTYATAETLLFQGHLAVLQGNYSLASQHMRKALVLRRRQAAPLGIAVTLFYNSWLAFQQGDYQQMEKLNRERLAIEQSMGNPQGIADSNLWLGVAALWQGDTQQALILLQSSLEQLRYLGEPRNLTHVLDTSAHAMRSAGDLPQAQRHQQERLELLSNLGVWRGAAWSHIHLAQIALDQNDSYEARQRLNEAHSIIQEGRAPNNPTHLFADLSPRRDADAQLLIIESSAYLNLRKRNARTAACLLGAAQQLRQLLQLPFCFPDEHKTVVHTQNAAKEQLSKQQFTSQWETGHQLSLAQALAEATSRL